jgi:twitching motility protein PilT
MRDGALDGMQHFDGVLEKMVRDGVIEMKTALSYASNAGNLQLEMADLLGDAPKEEAPAKEEEGGGETELEIER